MKNPYQTLGVDKDAPASEVRKAYRRKAKRAHPDAGGSAAEFSELSRALAILINPKKRKEYDTTGTVDERPDNEQADAVGIILGIMMSAIAKHGERCLKVDLVKEVAKACKQIIENNEEMKSQLAAKIATGRKVMARLKRKKKGPTFLLLAMERAIEAQTEPLININKTIAQHDAALKMLKDYEFDFDATSTFDSPAVGAIPWQFMVRR